MNKTNASLAPLCPHEHIHIVLLSGGSGTRLWPLSNNTLSKQFLEILPDNGGGCTSMVQRTFSIIKKINAGINITIAAGEAQKSVLEHQIEGDYELVLEPERRNTAPAIMLACAHLSYIQRVPADDIVIVIPIDTYADEAYYIEALRLACILRGSKSEIALLGAKPLYPTDKYGYIVPKQNIYFSDKKAFKVDCFFEKPSINNAKKLISKGALWNCGIFAFRLNWIMGKISTYTRASSFEELQSSYGLLPRSSFDDEIVSKTNSIIAVPYNGVWKDLGTWNTLTEEMCDISLGAVIGCETCIDTHVINKLNTPVVALGLNNTIIAATPDGILVTDKAFSSNVKPYVQKANAERPMCEQRQWGEYRILDLTEKPSEVKSLVKELIINPGKQLSYQRHMHRTEAWTVISGDGEVVLDGVTKPIIAGDMIEVSKGQLHSLRAKTKMKLVEVQLGDILDENDIQRIGNYWPE